MSMPEERCPVIDEIVTGLELFAAQAEATLEAAHQDVATAEALMLEALKLAPETPVIKRTIIQLALRDMLEKRACKGKGRRKTGQDLQDNPVSPEAAKSRHSILWWGVHSTS
jgi:hypothetical protein